MQDDVHAQKRTLKTIAPNVAQVIRQFASESRQILKDHLVAEYLFGSYATNTQTPLSDIDILILVSKNAPELQWQMSGLASEYSLEYDVCISPILQDIEVWKKKPAGTHIILSRSHQIWDSIMIDQTTIALSAHRLDKAKEALKQAEVLLDNGGYDGSVNRSYYAIFNAIRSLLALVNLDSRRHSGVISFFDRYFVKTGIFEKSFSHIVHSAFDVRQMSDYEDYAAPTAEQAKQQVEAVFSCYIPM